MEKWYFQAYIYIDSNGNINQLRFQGYGVEYIMNFKKSFFKNEKSIDGETHIFKVFPW